MSEETRIVHLPDRLRILRDDRHAASYVYRGNWRPYFWPLNARHGSVVRGVNGSEHPNHYGLCLTYGRHASDGTTNIWSDFDEPPFGPCGRMLHDGFDAVRTDEDGSALIDEETIWTSGSGHPIARDFRSYELRFLPDEELLLLFRLELPPPAEAEPGEVRFFARIADPLRVTGGDDDHAPGQIVDSEGREMEGSTRGESARWCDYSGHFSDGPGGITLMTHPDNPQSPAEILTRNYGPFSTSQEFESRRPHVFKWGAYVHNGLTEDAGIEDAFEVLAEW